MTNIIAGTPAPADYFPNRDIGPPNADLPLPPMQTQSASAERRVHLQGSAAWLSKQTVQDKRAGDRPSFHRTLSFPPARAAADGPRVANGLPEWSAQRMRQVPDLDALYGLAHPPRAKPGKASGIQKAERNPQDGMVIIHPGRIVLNPVLTPELPARLQEVRDELQAGAVYKWNISRNGQLMLAKSKHPGGEKLGWGHPTLVGGLKEPEARIGGELRFGNPDNKYRGPVFYINNDSGRYSEYGDRIDEMLANVAHRFEALDFLVKTQWIDKSEEALTARAELKSKKLARNGVVE